MNSLKRAYLSGVGFLWPGALRSTRRKGQDYPIGYGAGQNNAILGCSRYDG